MSNPTELPDLERLSQIGHLIATQDNRYTDQPMFIVQQRRRVYGFDTDYCENIIWVCSEDDYSEASVEEAAELEAEYQESGRVKSGWQRTGYMDQWEFVTACFTEQGCKDYLKRDGHNLKEPRIYADGSYRNEEFRAVRNSLIALARRAQPEGEAPQADAETLLYEHQRAVEGAFEYGETGGFYEALEASKQAIRDALAIPVAAPAAQHAESGALAVRMEARRYCKGDAEWTQWREITADEYERRKDDSAFEFRPLAAQSQGAQAAPDDRALLAALAEAADVFMKGGVAPLRPLIDRAKAVAAQQAALATKAEAPAPEWGRVRTVADMVRNLLTLDQGAPIHAAFPIEFQGKRRMRTSPITISRERVIDGKWIDQTRKDVPYANVVWAKPDDRAQQAAAPGALDLMNADEMAALRRFDETCQDGEGYDVPKTMMQRLAAIGVVRRTSGSYYETTEFGLRVLDQPAPSAPGTPEAPSDAGIPASVRTEVLDEITRFSPDAWIRKSDITELTDSEPETGGWEPLYKVSRAAQLDGGQGEKP